MEDEVDETGAAASLLALHTMAVWLVRQELERAPEARTGLMRHTEIAMAMVVRRDPGLLVAAQDACTAVAQAMGEAPTAPRLQ
jgi:hypothetical protein